MINDYSKGGLKMIDIASFNNAMYAMYVCFFFFSFFSSYGMELLFYIRAMVTAFAD